MNTPNFPFVPADKTPRLNRNVIISEKLDGTRATIFIDDSGELFCGSRTRWITPQNDNFGFARWAEGNREDLLKLGPGRHDGEFYGQGIQRNYNLKERRFALFNASRWLSVCEDNGKPLPDHPGVFEAKTLDDGTKVVSPGPGSCYVVPLIWKGVFDLFDCRSTLEMLRVHGSFAVPGWTKPEGIVIFHEAAKKAFKVTCENDESPKGVPGLTDPQQLIAGVDAAEAAFKQKIVP